MTSQKIVAIGSNTHMVAKSEKLSASTKCALNELLSRVHKDKDVNQVNSLNLIIE